MCSVSAPTPHGCGGFDRTFTTGVELKVISVFGIKEVLPRMPHCLSTVGFSGSDTRVYLTKIVGQSIWALALKGR